MSGTYELKLAAILILLFASVLTPANASLSLQQQCSYYFGKLHGSEFLDMPYVFDMGLLRAKIFDDGFKHSLVFVPIDELTSIHSIDYDHSIKKLSERAHHLTAFREEILSNNQVSIKFQEQVIPSKNPIRAIRMMNGELVVFDGNGRLESLRMAFSKNPNLKIEVDVFTNSSPTIDEIIHRIRLRNGLEVPTVTPPPEFPKEAKHFFALLQQSQKKHNPHLDHQLFAHANELSPNVKKQVLNEIKKSKISNNKLKNELRLLLYDEAKWYELLNDLLKKPGNEKEIANSYRLAALLHMPDDLRFKVLRKISSVYSQLSKSRSRIGIKLPVFLTRNLLAPKRFADFILRNLIRADLIIDQAIKEEGRSTLEGLQKYYEILHKDVLGLTNFGNYSAQEVKRVGETLQKELKKWASMHRDSHPRIIIGGSFPSGRARLESSDLDVRVEPPELAKSFPQFETAIQKAFMTQGSQVDLHIEQVWSSQGVTRLAVINPILMNITPEKVELWVYPPLSIPKHDQDFRLNLYPEPKIFNLINF